MRTRWMLAATVLGTMAGFTACAAGVTQSPTTSSTGSGGMPGTGGTATVASSSSTTSTGGAGGTGGAASSSSTTGGSSCGNGVKDPGEQCDGTDFGGKTCQSLGLGSGQLICNQFCGIVATACEPKENCNNGQDDNGDLLVDCDDPECVGATACMDTCTPPMSTSIPNFGEFGDTTGRPAVHAASCSSAMSGKEAIYQVTAPVDGTMTATLDSFGGADFSLSVRTDCEDDASEIACANKVGPGGFDSETLAIDVTAGTTYFVMVDGVTPQDFGSYDLYLDIPLPESDCFNLFDDDGDGYVDCDDATDCQTLPDCMPGMTPVGQPCIFPSDCQANHNDPVCLSNGQGFPGSGYCSEFCDVVAQDCAANAICYAGLNLSVNGVCLQTCTQDTDCDPALSCVDKGLAQKVCVIGPEKDCSNYLDDDNDGLIDCQDPDACQTLPACVPGNKATGQPCTMNTECVANMNDPICMTDMLGFVGGYCSQFCNMAPDDCGLGSICTFEGPGGAQVCMQACNTNAQCRPGYGCFDFGYPKKICSF